MRYFVVFAIISALPLHSSSIGTTQVKPWALAGHCLNALQLCRYHSIPPLMRWPVSCRQFFQVLLHHLSFDRPLCPHATSYPHVWRTLCRCFFNTRVSQIAVMSLFAIVPRRLRHCLQCQRRVLSITEWPHSDWMPSSLVAFPLCSLKLSLTFFLSVKIQQYKQVVQQRTTWPQMCIHY